MKLFDNTAIAFSNKNDIALERAYFLFKLIANQPLVKIGAKVASFALKSHLPVEGLIRATVFDHFCAGTSANESLKVVKQLEKDHVFSVLDYSAEGAKEEISLDECLQNTIATIQTSKQSSFIPFAVFKPTGFAHPSLLKKISENAPLTEDEIAAWERVRKRFYKCIEAAKKAQIKVLIDAEESWLQPAVDEIIEDLMMTFNKEIPIVHTTAQLYLKKRLDYLPHLLSLAKEKGFIAGVKLVRGAYMEKEAVYAEQKGIENPVCSSKEETDTNFNLAWKFMLDHLDHFSLYFGSHNEDSTYAILEEIEKRNIPKDHPHLWFGQLYGMSDHITFNLAKIGYKTSKYLPFGPVKDVLPYLIRRAEENTSVEGQSVRELELIHKERKRRRLT